MAVPIAHEPDFGVIITPASASTFLVIERKKTALIAGLVADLGHAVRHDDDAQALVKLLLGTLPPGCRPDPPEPDYGAT